MTDPKSFASLGPSLLARKGAARPAMRPQYGSLARILQPDMPEMEDLGWNDMGNEPEETPVASRAAAILPLTPASAEAMRSAPDHVAEPEVRQQQRKIAETLGDTSPSFASLRSIKPRRSAFEQGRRAAFTLRLDAKRHMKLRLATAAQGRSAQQLVTEALDRFLDGIPDLNSLSAQSKRD